METWTHWYAEGPLRPSAAWASVQTQIHKASNRNFGSDARTARSLPAEADESLKERLRTSWPLFVWTLMAVEYKDMA